MRLGLRFPALAIALLALAYAAPAQAAPPAMAARPHAGVQLQQARYYYRAYPFAFRSYSWHPRFSYRYVQRHHHRQYYVRRYWAPRYVRPRYFSFWWYRY